MFYSLFYYLKDNIFVLNIFKYITFRAAMAALTTFFISILLGNYIIDRLRKLKIQENIRKEGFAKLYDVQHYKQGTPTMGGLLIVISVIFSTLLWANIFNKYIILTLLTFLALAILGFADDYLKLKEQNSKGLNISTKFVSQLVIGLLLAIVLFLDKEFSTKLYFPFFKNLVIDLGILYIPFVILVICGASNAVNFTDGLDGLAVGCTIMTALTFSLLSYVTGHAKFSQYLLIPFIPHAGELTVFCAALVGACMGFLWFNCFPAGVFMGDVGSLAIGGAIGMVALLIKKEILLVIVGGIFVIEALSVIIQIIAFRIWKKRFFKMAPLHHHFQILGLPESKIIVRFWIISAILAIFTLITLKIR
ncbi:MAG: phospho-N-acetylmuramoyl-pentapeptide-transferase [Candidatus Omnitrophica bacterium]|nr:phospho-N-acetylmuramoyl-pentapeptide-transferase [Candidatus Omnitrophota bacterium]MDD5352795.1 phospho-N-acetylmuramoyl-pentapeptide-transferase [Candidatus Omnitrophota bacterium]MDD5550394.1 phospho-N-acetylmuramoyl-pentapeptide-transferase [Candidatus Omnitrophota bacterium]